MPRGGARNRSGPQPDENSGRSDRRGLKLDALPSEGFAGEVPKYPLPPLTVWWEYYSDGQKVREVDEKATDARRKREVELWSWAWRTPQACAWAREPWRHHSVAMWVRTSALCESSAATAADKNSLHRFADQIGLTPAGLKENGWKIATDELAEKRSDPPAQPRDDVRGRLAVVTRADAG